MKLTESQKMMLFQVLVDSLTMIDDAGVLAYNYETRKMLHDKVIKQNDEMLDD